MASDGRDPVTGRFAPGWRGGKGNPLARRVGRLRAELLRAVTPEDIRGVVDALLAEARGGNVAAIRELLDRTLRKPVARGKDMASVFKPTCTKSIPKGASITTEKGQRLAVWLDRKGRKQSAPLTADGDRVRLEGLTYFARWRDGAGRLRTASTGCRDKASALRWAAEQERRGDKVRSGLLSAGEDAALDHVGTPFAEHVAGYLEHLRTKPGKGGRLAVNPTNLANAAKRLATLAEDLRLNTLADVARDPLERWMRARAAEGRLSPETVNLYASSLVALCNWAVDAGRMLANPLHRLRKLGTRDDVRRQRRALTDDEIARLLTVASLRPLAEHGRGVVRLADAAAREDRKSRATWKRAPLTFDGIHAAAERARRALRPDVAERLAREGRERALVYRVLLLTGLRRGELESLTVADARLDETPPYVRLKAASEKAGRGADVPLRGDLADELRAWVAEAGRAPGDRLLTVPDKLVKVMDRDLAAAGIPKRDERGRTVDVHALRHTFGTHLSRAGAAPRTAQAAMRHSTLDLTMRVYTDPKLLDVAGALDALPAMQSTDAEAAPPADLASHLASTGVPEGQSVAKRGKSGKPTKKGLDTFSLEKSGQTAPNLHKMQWAVRDSNPRPSVLETDALPRPSPCNGDALTN